MLRTPGAFALVLIAAIPAVAQDPSNFVSPRPDKCEPPDVVERGVLQIESAAYYQRTSGAYDCSLDSSRRSIDSRLTAGSSLLRVGVADGVEMRLESSFASERIGVDSCSIESRLEARTSDIAQPTVGVKARLMDEETAGLGLSVASSVTLPFGASIGIESLAPSVRITSARSIADGVTVVGNLAAAWDGTSMLPAAAYTLSLSGQLTDDVGAYVGFFGDLTEGSANSHSIDAGVSATVSESVSLEVFGAMGLDERARDFYVGTGVVLAFP